MNVEILSYVEKMEAAVLNDLVTTDASDLYQIALDMIEDNKNEYHTICQAYEVVRHNLVG